jgi:hypothetical protein
MGKLSHVLSLDREVCCDAQLAWLDYSESRSSFVSFRQWRFSSLLTRLDNSPIVALLALSVFVADVPGVAANTIVAGALTCNAMRTRVLRKTGVDTCVF